MAAPKKPVEARHKVRNISMPPGLWEQAKEAAGDVPVSRWICRLIEDELADQATLAARPAVARLPDDAWAAAVMAAPPAQIRRGPVEFAVSPPIEPALPPDEFPAPGKPTMDLLETCDGPGGPPVRRQPKPVEAVPQARNPRLKKAK